VCCVLCVVCCVLCVVLCVVCCVLCVVCCVLCVVCCVLCVVCCVLCVVCCASAKTGTVVHLKKLCQKSCVRKKKGSDTKNFQHNGSILKDRTLEHAKEFENRIVTNIWVLGFHRWDVRRFDCS
jgi:hypothetical protein